MIKAFSTLKALGSRIAEDKISLVSAGVAFFSFLSLFPALASVISIYGLVANPETIERQIAALASVVPENVLSLISERAHSLVSNQTDTLTIGLVAGILLSFWSANKAMKAIADALNIAYDISETRGFVKKNIVTLGLTGLATAAFIVTLFVIVALPILIVTVLTYKPFEWIASGISWSLFIAIVIGLFLMLYSYAPAKKSASRKRLLPGAIVAAFLQIMASVAFSFYVANFGKYDEQYGAVGAVVVTMMWFYLGAYIFLIGAEINAYRLHGDKKTPYFEAAKEDTP